METKPKKTARAEKNWIALVTGKSTFPGGPIRVFSPEIMMPVSAARKRNEKEVRMPF
jgi:hypothetical protein